MTSDLVIARKELLDLRRNRFLLAILGFVLVAVVISVVVSAARLRPAKQLQHLPRRAARRKHDHSSSPAAVPLQELLRELRSSTWRSSARCSRLSWATGRSPRRSSAPPSS